MREELALRIGLTESRVQVSDATLFLDIFEPGTRRVTSGNANSPPTIPRIGKRDKWALHTV